jgi:PAS domain S-box-containing protein
VSDNRVPLDGNIFHSIADPIYVLDGTGEILDVNEAATERYGYSREEFRGMDVADVSSGEPPYTRSNAIGRIEEALEGTPQVFEWQGVDSDGNACWEEMSLCRATVDGEPRVIATLSSIEERKRTERTLEEERERHSSLVEQSPDGIVIVQDRELKFVNPALADLTGRPESALHGLPFDEIIAPEDRELVRERYEKRIRGENPPEQYEIEVLTADDERRYVDLTVSSITYRGEPATLATFTDITERKRIEQDLRNREAKFRILAENLDTVVWMYDPEADQIVYVNSAYKDVWGQPRESLYDHPRAYVDNIHPEDRDSVREALSTQETGEYSEEYRVVRPDGAVRWISDYAVPVHSDDGEVFQIVGIAEDITDRKRHEQELQRQNQRLEKFMSVVSHDLRNPLTVVKGRLALIEDEQTEVIDQNLERMEAIIDDILTLARQGQSIDGIEPIQLREVAKQCWSHVATSEATLVVESNATLHADPERLRQLLENLFRNGIEHTGDGVTIRLGPLPDGFYVADDGPGIPEADQERVFEYGFTTNERGTGFGLNIVEEIAHAHGWTVDMTDSAEGGVRFEFAGAK